MKSPVMWYGGKGNMVSKLLRYVPYHEEVRVYVEPYCGGASLFFAKRPHTVEVLNDLDESVITIFRALQDKVTAAELHHRLLNTPYARAEYLRALELLEQDDDDGASLAQLAWAYFVAQNQVLLGLPTNRTPGRWSRTFYSTGGVALTVNRWLMRLHMIPEWQRRLMMAQIDCRDALEVIAYWDSPGTVFYLDPPYPRETRVDTTIYAHEPDLAHHQALVELLLRLQGGAILSSYRHAVHEALEDAGWRRIDVPTSAFSACRGRQTRIRGDGSAMEHAPRTESVWLSPAVQRWHAHDRQESLFELDAS